MQLGVVEGEPGGPPESSNSRDSAPASLVALTRSSSRAAPRPESNGAPAQKPCGGAAETDGAAAIYTQTRADRPAHDRNNTSSSRSCRTAPVARCNELARGSAARFDAHRSTVIARQSSLDSHRSTIIARRAAPRARRPALGDQRPALETQRLTQRPRGRHSPGSDLPASDSSAGPASVGRRSESAAAGSVPPDPDAPGPDAAASSGASGSPASADSSHSLQ
jgi:hypothetical protein